MQLSVNMWVSPGHAIVRQLMGYTLLSVDPPNPVNMEHEAQSYNLVLHPSLLVE